MHRVQLPIVFKLCFRERTLFRPLANSSFALGTQSYFVPPTASCIHHSTTSFTEPYADHVACLQLHASKSSSVLGIPISRRSWKFLATFVEAHVNCGNFRTFTLAGYGFRSRAGKMEVIPDTNHLMEVDASSKCRKDSLGRTPRSASKAQGREKKTWCELANLLERRFEKEEALQSRLIEVTKRVQEEISFSPSGIVTHHLRVHMCSVFLIFPTQAFKRLNQLTDLHERYIHHKSLLYHSSSVSLPVRPKNIDHQPSTQSSHTSSASARSVHAEVREHHWLQGSSYHEDVEGLTKEEKEQLLKKTWSRRSRCTVCPCLRLYGSHGLHQENALQ